MNTLFHKKGYHLKHYVFIFTFLIFSCSLIGSDNPDQNEGWVQYYYKKGCRAYATRTDPTTQRRLIGIIKNEVELDKTRNNRRDITNFIQYPSQTYIPILVAI